MAEIEDLGYFSVTDKSRDENLEELRRIRLSRRIPDKQAKARTASRKKKELPEVEVSPEQAAHILELLGEKE